MTRNSDIYLWRRDICLWRWIVRLSACLPLMAHSVDLEQLSVPQTYLRYLPSLYDVARLVADTERCERFIKGEIQVDRSTPEQPVFRFYCRDQGQQLYAWLVDGLTREVLDDTRPSGRVSFETLAKEQEQERIRAQQRQQYRAEVLEQLRSLQRNEVQAQQEEEAQRLYELWLQQEQIRRDKLWQGCQGLVQQQVRNMLSVEWLTQAMPEPLIADDGAMSFDIDFDARDPGGQALHYRAQCRANTEDDLVLRIRPRRLAEMETQ